MKNDLISKKVASEGYRIFSLSFPKTNHNEVLIAAIGYKDSRYRNKYWFSLFKIINNQYIWSAIGTIHDKDLKTDAIANIYFNEHRSRERPTVKEITEQYK